MATQRGAGARNSPLRRDRRANLRRASRSGGGHRAHDDYRHRDAAAQQFRARRPVL